MPAQPKEKGNRHIAENPVIADCFHTDSPLQFKKYSALALWHIIVGRISYTAAFINSIYHIWIKLSRIKPEKFVNCEK